MGLLIDDLSAKTRLHEIAIALEFAPCVVPNAFDKSVSNQLGRLSFVSSMKKHLPLILLRLAIAFCIVQALPFAHMNWGHEYPGDGQESFGFIVIFYAIGIGAAAIYLLATSLWHCYRQLHPRFGIVSVDLLIGACFVGILSYGGITATYSDSTPSSPTASDATQPNTGR